MAIKHLSWVVYEETGWGWNEDKIHDPTWKQIEAAIRRLDKFRYPYVWLFIGDNDSDPVEDCLTVMGGEGVYWVCLYAGPNNGLQLFDPNKGSHEVEVWTSDQGASYYEFRVTYDIELIFRIVKHFGETGEPLPDVTWEVYDVAGQ